MNVVEAIKHKAVVRANSSNSLPFIGAFVTRYYRETEHFDELHHAYHSDKSGRSKGCGCKYCVTLNKYANARILEHQLNKRLYWEYDIGPAISHESLLSAIAEQERVCKTIRSELVKLAENLKVPNSVKRKSE